MEEQTRPERMRNAWSRAYYQSQQHQAESMSSTSSGVHETCFKARGHDLQGLTVAHGKASPPGRLLLHPWMHSDSFYGLRSRNSERLQKHFASQGISTSMGLRLSPSQGDGIMPELQTRVTQMLPVRAILWRRPESHAFNEEEDLHLTSLPK